ncbi:MAG TPA: bifunctional phosphoribosylaminoimidazolecarboxamide formyltransferase/IMP cyclohydrolase [Candidatus Bathyarchaeia archaeon]|nr:bifunctional phosphoribosylaminoimidazolecarboxamide formyltransferase/IMP cyclohydrolase [Candidatus Bathyarchaeia archaeon]
MQQGPRLNSAHTSGNSSEVKRALISVSDKTGVADFAKALEGLGIEIISTGGTSRFLVQSGVHVREISDFTGFPEILNGRVKTLHPKVHGSILFRRNNEEDRKIVEALGLEQIDLVAVNLYPFEEVTKRQGVDLEEAVENIDIGGPALIRSAAKNYRSLTVVVDPHDYDPLLEELREKGAISSDTRFRLMKKAFRRTALYDSAIEAFFEKVSQPTRSSSLDQEFPERLMIQFDKIQDLRYGENPHQRAAVYKDPASPICIADAKQLSGKKQLGYNNILDADAAYSLIREFRGEIASIIIKHTNPCGGAIGDTLLESLLKALQTDPVSAYGGVYAFSSKVDIGIARELSNHFMDVILAPGYEPEALELLSQKKNCRILDITELLRINGGFSGTKEFRSVLGGMLYQEPDEAAFDPDMIIVPTSRKPNDTEIKAALFGLKFVKHVKSNAITLTTPKQLLGVGAGQMSRVDSCKLAIQKAREAGSNPAGSAMASDAFLPFRDVVDVAAEAGVSVIIQPGGSIRDDEIVKAADEKGLAMMLTGRRSFRH